MGIAIGSWTWDDETRELRRGDEQLELTKLERDLLAFLIQRSGQTASRAELLREVWKYAPSVRSRADAKTVARLRSKLGDDGACLVTVYGRGYRLDIASDVDLVGREDELLAAREALHQHRLVTLHGVGGVGKTRLARSLVQGWASTLWIPARERETVDAVVLGVAGALELGPVSSPDAIDAALAEAGRVLLVLDEVEHVVEGLMPRVHRWLELAPDIAVLLTSRVLADDSPWVAVSPLSPEASVELFQRRARRVRPQLEVPTEQLEPLMRILEGVPLAIELAAARLRVLDLKRLTERVRRNFELLRDRKRSLHATLHSSWDLLQPAEREVLAAASLFPGSFTTEALEELVDTHDVLDALDGLVRAALIVDEGAQWRLLEMVRSFARPRVDEAQVAAFVSWAARLARKRWRGAEVNGEPVFHALVRESSIFDEAAALCTNPQDLAWLASALASTDERTGWRVSTANVLDAVDVDGIDAEPAVAISLMRAVRCFVTGVPRDGLPHARKAWERAQSSQDPILQGVAWIPLVGGTHFALGSEAAEPLVNDLTQWLATQSLPPFLHARVLGRIAEFERAQGLPQFKDRVMKALALLGDSDDSNLRFLLLNLLALSLSREGRAAEALSILQDAFAGAVESGARCAVQLGRILSTTHLAMGNREQAREAALWVTERARQVGDVFNHLASRFNYAALIDEPLEKELVFREIKEGSIRHGLPRLAAQAVLFIGYMRHADGRLDEAIVCYRETRELGTDAPPIVTDFSRCTESLALAEQGQHALSEQRWRETLDAVEPLVVVAREMTRAALDGRWAYLDEEQANEPHMSIRQLLDLAGRLRP
ncbi:MAG: winged helix-turn-helix domain-containing protein [Myxococcota bacterium]